MSRTALIGGAHDQREDTMSRCVEAACGCGYFDSAKRDCPMTKVIYDLCSDSFHDREDDDVKG